MRKLDSADRPVAAAPAIGLIASVAAAAADDDTLE